ncbi:hypothetical protein EAV90_34945 [Bradyrhizobium vignae]|nr:hypothetical protein EAV90_34945 [Bradyrhizobium vignae]
MPENHAQLTMRPTVIGGEMALGDYTVIWDGLRIGRIFKAAGLGGHDAWSWSVSLPNRPQPSSHRGQAASLEEAKALFRAAWTELRERLNDRQIEQVRAIDADRSRPWHK